MTENTPIKRRKPKPKEIIFPDTLWRRIRVQATAEGIFASTFVRKACLRLLQASAEPETFDGAAAFPADLWKQLAHRAELEGCAVITLLVRAARQYLTSHAQPEAT